MSFTELLRSQGYEPSHRVLASQPVNAPTDVASDLGVAEGTPCRYLRRLLLADGEPVGVSQTWLPSEVLGGHEGLLDPEGLGGGSLYALLQEPPVGLALHRAVETVNPAAADPDAASLLGIEPGSPVLVLKRITFDPDERPVESTRLVFAGDRYEYRVELYRPTGGEG
jgi:GntR family transcriptional regulator